ncbi:hypothetical protein CWE15_03635 [Aliidiomarina taiwanensis]|uniref:Uncharacterized protein n=1 Tax=Aliidiomarina taiwanensis TaxID=946228 RepID=A0A432XA33_9GAMM|nr:WYL domain-containing protein [Aliidiomarina taiwanensis]RUO44272.1 hypothetical protein CWE15_03635 [Aliidiomarina taiwanensis]
MASDQTIRAIDILLFLYDKEATVRDIYAHLVHEKEHCFTNEQSAMRAIQRTLNQLEDRYGLYRHEAGLGVPVLWSVDSTQFEKLLSLDESLALAMVIAEQQVKEIAEPLISNAVSNLFERAKAQLAVTNRASNKWRERVKVKPASHRLERPQLCETLFKEVLSAALEQDGLRFEYRRAHDKPPMDVECMALAFYYRGPQAYLIARMPDKSIRRFPLTRMSNVRRCLTTSIEVGDFDLDEYEKRGELEFLNTGRLPELGESFRLQAEVFVSVVREIEYAPLGPRQTITPISGRDNYYTLEVDVPNTLHLAQWVLARAPYLHVLSPNPFRAYLESELRQALRHIDNKHLEVPKLN